MYFGELALLRGEPRAATVAALSDTSLLMLARQDFNQLLGPLQALLGQHAALYGPTQAADVKQVTFRAVLCFIMYVTYAKSACSLVWPHPGSRRQTGHYQGCLCVCFIMYTVYI